MKLRNIVDKILERAVVILMGALVLDVLWQVASRYIFQDPSSFTDELAGFLLIWVGLLGAAWAAGMKQHLAIDLLSQKLSPERRKYLDVLVNILVMLFALAVMVVGGIWLVYTRFYLGQISAAMQIPLGYVYLVVPLSGFLIIFYSIDEIARLTKNPNAEKI
ncbi:TRAP transporter small permease [Prolixibacter denitrificans]|uniref:C4-dicarboxylate ABC transporter permease n=1 Tax=Prolixibacter denitrificans TaxID=1541063 RepID=A0A2P8C9T3_9BACT|nr:TRAP transporter small permease [Prolixibacter denitrificans]PSK81725.1 TRAP-type C4-dicarboxylate transport system permease small subunit [Prolixibacter denitrificans]GET21246.1 C4-dicarboxylate ABC transporter permease [Prolixibacter denitrificans]